MGLTFSVGGPGQVFEEPFASAVREVLRDEYGAKLRLEDGEDHYWSDELAWSGWAALQDLASTHLASAQLEHLLSMEAWSGVFVPLETEPGEFEFEDRDTPLDVASLPRLAVELETLGKLLKLPIDDDGLRSLASRYSDDDDLVDSDMEIQTYAQLLLATHEALRRVAPLWVVK